MTNRVSMYAALVLCITSALMWIGSVPGLLGPSLYYVAVNWLPPYTTLLFGSIFVLSYFWLFTASSIENVRAFVLERLRLVMAVLLIICVVSGVFDVFETGLLHLPLASASLVFSVTIAWFSCTRRGHGGIPMLVGVLVVSFGTVVQMLSLPLITEFAPAFSVAWLGILIAQSCSWVILDKESVINNAATVSKLEREILKRTKDLRLALENSERTAALQRDFLATMSHELRTPLASAIGLCRMMSNDGQLSTPVRRDLGTIERLAVNLLRMVDEGLEFVRQRGVQESSSPKPVDMRNLLRDLESVAGWLCQQQGNRFSMTKIKNVPTVLLFDERRLRQILINLVSNAGRFCQNGEVTMEVSFQSTRTEAKLDWRVNDSGKGMTKEELARAFEPFVKSRDSQGLGLGLALVKKLAAEMGGTISARSAVNLGTQFLLSVPVVTENNTTNELNHNAIFNAVQHEIPISRPMGLLSDQEIDMLDLRKLQAYLRLGQLTEIENWVKRAEAQEDFSAEAKRFVDKVRCAVHDVDLALIQVLINEMGLTR